MGRGKQDGFNDVMGSRRGTELPGGSAERFKPAPYWLAPTCRNEEDMKIAFADMSSYLYSVPAQPRVMAGLEMWARLSEHSADTFLRASHKADALLRADNDLWLDIMSSSTLLAEMTVDESGCSDAVQPSLEHGVRAMAKAGYYWALARHVLDADETDELLRALPSRPISPLP